MRVTFDVNDDAWYKFEELLDEQGLDPHKYLGQMVEAMVYLIAASITTDTMDKEWELWETMYNRVFNKSKKEGG